MYAQVVVLTYQSPEIDSYTYEIPEELENRVNVGQLVSVPFGKRIPYGIVLSITPNVIPAKAGILKGQADPRIREDDRTSQIHKKEIRIKPISSIILEKPFILPYQIELLKWMSAYYIAPMVNCLDSMLPEIPKRLENFQPSTFNFQLSIQTLVLVPSINRLPQTLAQFPKAKNYVVYHNELAVSEKFGAWQKILFNQHDFIFGSRSAIFTPCPNIKKIIIFDEHDGAYKDIRSPYFDTLTVAEKISELTNAKIEIVDISPRITTFYNSIRHSDPELVEGKESRSFSLRLQDDRVREVQTKIISLTNEKKLRNFSPISLTLEEIIKRAFSKKLSILLFLNKKIASGSIYCKACKHQEFVKTKPDNCPNCTSAEIFFNSTNINSLARELKKILPGAQINLIAERVRQSTIDPLRPHLVSYESERARSETSNQQLTIDIATASVFYRMQTKKYDLVAHIYADSPLNFNDYNSSEEIFSQIMNLKKLTKKLLVVQTYNDDLPAIKFASSNNYLAFYKSEINPRKALNYPPFSQLVKITFRGKSAERLESKAQNLCENLKQQAASNKQKVVQILGPYRPIGPKLRYNILLKIKLDSYSLSSRMKTIEKIRPILKIAKDAQIAVEPDSMN